MSKISNILSNLVFLIFWSLVSFVSTWDSVEGYAGLGDRLWHYLVIFMFWFSVVSLFGSLMKDSEHKKISKILLIINGLIAWLFMLRGLYPWPF